MCHIYFLTCCSSHVEVKESQRRSSTDHVSGDTESAPPITDEMLVAVQEQEHPHNKLFSETMNTT